MVVQSPSLPVNGIQALVEPWFFHYLPATRLGGVIRLEWVRSFVILTLFIEFKAVNDEVPSVPILFILFFWGRANEGIPLKQSTRAKKTPTLAP